MQSHSMGWGSTFTGNGLDDPHLSSHGPKKGTTSTINHHSIL